MDKPLITFVLPTKNRIEWCAEAIMSLLAQTEKNIQLVIIDDASTDGTAEFLDDFVSKDPRVIVIHNEVSIGAGASRNLGTTIAMAPIVAQFDDDDISVDERAEITLRWFKEHPESEMVNFPYVRIGYFNEVKQSFEGAPFDLDHFKKSGGVTYFCNPSVAYRKESFEQTRGYQTENAKETDDYGFVRNWVDAGKKIDFLPGEPVVLHRVLPDSMMSSQRGWSEDWVK